MAEGQQTIGETLERADVLATGESIARVQDRSGAIAWPDGHVDAWDHVECAMALSACGLREPARRAYRWLRETQRADGSWARSVESGRVTDLAAESDHAAYVAVGAWHEYLVTGDERHALAMWPTVLRGDAGQAGRRPAAGLGTRGGPARAPGGPAPGGVRGQEPVRHGLVLPGARRRGPRRGRGPPGGVGVGHVRGPRAGRPVRERRAVGHRGRDLRAGHRAGRLRDAQPGAGGVRERAAPASPGRLLLDWLAVRQPGAVPAGAVELDRGRGGAGGGRAGRLQRRRGDLQGRRGRGGPARRPDRVRLRRSRARMTRIFHDHEGFLVRAD